MIELQTSVKRDDTTRTRTPKPGYLNLSNTCGMNYLGVTLLVYIHGQRGKRGHC
jgi:hypothetical protein